MTQPIRAGGRGFKIADGFVEVTGVHDRRSTQRAARQAGNEAGDSFMKAMLARMAAKAASIRQILGLLFPGSLFIALPIITALTAGIGALVAAIVALGGSLGLALGSLAAMLPLILGLVSAFATFKLAAEAVAESRAWKNFVEQAKELKQTVGREFVPGMSDLLNAMTRRLPLVNEHLKTMAQILGQAMSDLGRFISAEHVGETLQRIFRELERATRAWSDALRPALGILLIIADTAAPLFTRLSEWVRDLANSFERFLLLKRSSGELQRFFQAAGDEMAKWGRIIGNIIGGLAGIFIAAAGPGRELASSLERVTAQFREWAFSEQGRQQVRSILEFFLGLDIGKIFSLAAAIVAVGVAIKGLAAATGIVQGILLIAALGPIGAIVLGFIATLGLLAGAFVFAWTQSEAFRTSVVEIGQKIMDRVVPALKELWSWFSERILPLLMEAGTQIKEHLVDNLEKIFQAIDDNDESLAQLWEWFKIIAEAVAEVLIPAITDLITLWMDQWGTTLATVIGWSDELVSAIETLIQTYKDAESEIQGFVDFLDGLFGMYDTPTEATNAFKRTILDFFNNLPGLVMQALVSLPGVVQGILATALEIGLDVAATGIENIIDFFIRLPGRILDGIAALPSLLGGFFSRLAFRTGRIIGSGIGAWINHFVRMPGRIFRAIRSIPGLIIGVWNTARNRVVPAIGRFVGRMVSIFRGMPGRVFREVRKVPGRITRALAGIGRLLVEAGRDLIRGFIQGIRDQLPWLDAVLSGITAGLPFKKGPPEKDRRILRPSGQLVLGGFISGIEDEIPRLDRTLREITEGLMGAPKLRVAGGDGGTQVAVGQTAAERREARQPMIIENHIEIGGEVVRVVRVELDEFGRQVRSTARQFGARPPKART